MLKKKSKCKSKIEHISRFRQKREVDLIKKTRHLRLGKEGPKQKKFAITTTTTKPLSQILGVVHESNENHTGPITWIILLHLFILSNIFLFKPTESISFVSPLTIFSSIIFTLLY